ncbi:hypothetical protein M2272_003489 [Mycobacterium frederiksbergense]|uniref:PASTA domain-containing protein n=1 Tax=Mycolicibacterium frederiksbergense TaxID=117567 RepID=A0ABT6L1K7_9MYCO|nr:hypothetical protein [Mycolicibacterium frederiksbergense]MDH6196836.1 hypothetical protein [Mycolicibacterium frederiksbergense]
MYRSICAAAAMVALGGAGAAGPALAAPSAGTKAPDVVRELTDAGYAVQINGDNGVPLPQCTVTGVHGIPAAGTNPVQSTTAYVDVECEAEG